MTAVGIHEEVFDVYKRLYHYTTSAGLLGILENKSLWATHYSFLNDASEIKYFGKFLIDHFEPRLTEYIQTFYKKNQANREHIASLGGVDSAVEKEGHVWVDSFYQSPFDEMYITSFCGEHNDPYIDRNGLLSQWIGYGRDGGFALVFDTLELYKLLKQNEFMKHRYGFALIADVVYCDNKEKINSEIVPDANILFEYKVKNLAQGRPTNSGEAFDAFMRGTTKYKHRGFKEEREVRICVSPFAPDDIDRAGCLEKKKIKLRSQNGSLIPYIELLGGCTRLPIKQIIVGPHKEKEARALALKAILNKEIEIIVSDIPYVG